MTRRVYRSPIIKTDPRACPACHAKLGTAICRSTVGGEEFVPPTVGDVVTCERCGALLAWGNEMELRFATEAEYDRLDPALKPFVRGRVLRRQ